MITSYFARRFGRVADRLRIDVVVRDLVGVERLPPPALGLRAAPRVQDARPARRAPDASSPTARPRARCALRPSSFAALSRSACDTPLITNDPAVELRAARLERLLRHLDVGVLQLVAQRDERVVGVVVDREDGCRCPMTPLGALTSPFTSSIGASSTFASVTRTACTRERLPGTSSRCRRTAASARRSATSTDSRAARRRCASTADPCGRCSCRPGTRASSEAARGRRGRRLRCGCRRVGGGRAPAASPRRRRRGRRVRPARPPARPPGIVTVNAAVAREISTACFCSTRSSSACVPEARIARREHVGGRALRPSPSGSSACSCRRSCAGSRSGCSRSG